MATQLPYENEIYEKIKKEKITVHPLIWDLLTHHISDDLFFMMLALETSVLNTRYPKPMTKENAQKIFERALAIKDFITKLRRATGKEAGF